MIRTPYNRFVRIGLALSLLIAVLVISPSILFRDSDMLTALKSYGVAVSILYLSWILNLITLRMFKEGSAQNKTSWKRMLFSVLLVIVMMVAFSFFFLPDLPPPNEVRQGPPRENLPQPFYFKLISGIVFGITLGLLNLVLLEILLLRDKKMLMEAENQRLKAENMQAVNLLLKQQIQPHFLFNSLNTLKALIDKNKEEADRYLVKLAEFLRGSLSTEDSATISISDELSLCMNYLHLQKMRFGEALKSDINIPDKIKEQGRVPPFSIQLLLENAVKHNSFTEESPLLIRVSEQDEWIIVRNNVQEKSGASSSIGIGLSNLSARYKALADEEVLIENNLGEFVVRIKILTE